jgi:hypothetical protein
MPVSFKTKIFSGPTNQDRGVRAPIWSRAPIEIFPPASTYGGNRGVVSAIARNGWSSMARGMPRHDTAAVADESLNAG